MALSAPWAIATGARWWHNTSQVTQRPCSEWWKVVRRISLLSGKHKPELPRTMLLCTEGPLTVEKMAPTDTVTERWDEQKGFWCPASHWDAQVTSVDHSSTSWFPPYFVWVIVSWASDTHNQTALTVLLLLFYHLLGKSISLQMSHWKLGLILFEAWIQTSPKAFSKWRTFSRRS